MTEIDTIQFVEQPNFIETKKEEKTPENEHAEAVAFVKKHRDFFEHYAKGRIKVESAPEGLGTFAFDLEKNTIFVNSMFYKGQGFSDEKTLFAICHEIEHFLEKKTMLSEDGGERKFDKYLKKLKHFRSQSDNNNLIYKNESYKIKEILL